MRRMLDLEWVWSRQWSWPRRIGGVHDLRHNVVYRGVHFGPLIVMWAEPLDGE